MCGLLFSIRPVTSSTDPPPDPTFDAFLKTIAARGPDSLEIYTRYITLVSGHILEIKLASSVLGLRGDVTTVQPMKGERGILGWNGQVFQGMQISNEENDTIKVFERLEAGENPTDILASIEGPYAFIYHDTTAQTIHFQLDPLSRRSLLIQQNEAVEKPDQANLHHSRFIIASARCSRDETTLQPMRALDGGEGGVIELKKITVLEENGDSTLDMSRALTTHKLADHSQDIWTRVTPIDTSLPLDEPTIASIVAEVPTFLAKLLAAVQRRITNIPHPVTSSPRVCVLFSGGVDCTLLAALIHKCLPEDEPIELVNVAFQRPPAPAQKKATTPNSEADYAVPDRLSGWEAVEELRGACPGREWKFVEVNVTYKECQAHRQKVLDLMYPSATEMDLSLAFPLYFASRGIGTTPLSSSDCEDPAPYTIASRVYISGLGADEQLAGYARHRHAYRKGGWEGLISEIQMDISRLPTRNLSRDDRIISSHARDARFPYLDLSFISYVSSLPVWTKCDPTRDGGDKLLLRLAAKQLGLINTSTRVKRAMQFGTRSAKAGGSGGRGPKRGEMLVKSD